MSAAAAAPPPPVVKHVPSDELPEWMLPERTRVLTTTHSSSKNAKGKCIVYWMQRDVRTVDNWALLYAAHLAKEQKVPLRVLYCLMPPSDSDDTMAPFYEQPLTERYGHFLLGGLQLVHTELAEQKVPLHVVQPPSLDAVGDTVMDHVSSWQPSCIICDHSHLKPYRTWLDDQLVPLCNENASSMSVVHVDAHNVVPVWHAAPVRQIGARTLRPKIHKLLDQFLKSNDFPALQGANDHVSASVKLPDFEKDQYLEFLNLDGSVKSVDWAQPGTKAATMQFNSFTKTGLKQFHELRNDPNMGKIICSNLSPWINHGHVSFQRLAAIMQADFHKKYANGTAMYVEEGLIRRELSDNFVYYTPGTYDSLESALVWAQETLQVHAVDEREWSFTPAELEEAKSHDDLWNAAQLQLVQEGKLHGFVSLLVVF
jgi:deoxyribodipyrimidine photo-lyase